MMLKKLFTTLIVISAINSAIAGNISFNIDNIVDVQTSNGKIIPITNIIDGYESLTSLSINKNTISINTHDPQNIITDVQLYSGKVIAITDTAKLLLGGGGDIGGGGSK